MEQTKVLEALKGVRGERPVDLDALEQLMVRFSQMICEQPWIREIDINPLLASPDRFLALDARIVVHGAEVQRSGVAAALHPSVPDAVRRALRDQERAPRSPSGRSVPRTSR